MSQPEERTEATVEPQEEQPTTCFGSKWYPSGTRFWPSREDKRLSLWVHGGYGAPGVIRTPGLLLRRQVPTRMLSSVAKPELIRRPGVSHS
jgi:hypothetical protein